MNITEYIASKKAQLAEWEHALEKRTHLEHALAPWHAKKDELVKRLEALAGEASDRWDVLRMGIESAWAELEAAFNAVMEKEKERETEAERKEPEKREEQPHPRM